MELRIRITRRLDNLSKETAGGLAVTAALSMMAVVFVVGTTYDLSQLTKAKQRAQMVADSTALAASIAVDNNNEKRYKENVRYSYKQLGSPGVDFTKSITAYVTYDIVDDKDPKNKDKPEWDRSRLLARATVEGTYKPAFMGALGYSGMRFKAVSDVSYAASKGSPASVFFAVDNSGSMGSRDNQGQVKINTLKTSLNGFMATLGGIEGNGRKLFRTALYPYNGESPWRNTNYNGLLTHKMADPDWGTLTREQVSRMNAGGYTDSSGALERAKNKFTAESKIHEKENGETEPLKFLVFMTDGMNNPTTQRICETEQVWVRGSREYWQYTFWRPRWKRGRITYRSPNRRQIWKWDHHPSTSGHYEDREQCRDVEAYYRDTRSLEHCTAMKSAGVKIYAIAYDVARSEKTHAENFMRKCSSGAEYFKSATNASALEAAFEEIGASIVTEVIRIKR